MPGDFTIRDADPPQRDASDLSARGELKRTGVNDGSGVRRLRRKQDGTVVPDVADGDLGGKSRKPGIRQNLPCEICVEDSYG